MSTFAFPIAMSAQVTRSVAVAALLGVAMLASPLSAARAAPATTAPLQLAQSTASQSPPPAGATEIKPETVEQRITSLHTALQITPNEEADWTGVAQAMRDNAARMIRPRKA
jgi:protein CpxP